MLYNGLLTFIYIYIDTFDDQVTCLEISCKTLLVSCSKIKAPNKDSAPAGLPWPNRSALRWTKRSMLVHNSLLRSSMVDCLRRFNRDVGWFSDQAQLRILIHLHLLGRVELNRFRTDLTFKSRIKLVSANLQLSILTSDAKQQAYKP